MHKHCALLALLTLSVSAFAQTNPAPNEVDLKANYCVAVVEDSVAALQRVKHDPAKPYASEQEKKLSEALDAGLINAQADLKRLRVYLNTRLKEVEIKPMGDAKVSALTDLKAAEAEKSRCTSQCNADSPALASSTPDIQRQQRSSCLSACYSAIKVVAKMRACTPLNWLPN